MAFTFPWKLFKVFVVNYIILGKKNGNQQTLLPAICLLPLPIGLSIKASYKHFKLDKNINLIKKNAYLFCMNKLTGWKIHGKISIKRFLIDLKEGFQIP